MAEVSGGWVRDRPRLGWMDSVKVDLDKRGMTEEAARMTEEAGTNVPGRPGTFVTMSFTWPFLLGPVLFRTDLPCSCGYHLERGMMPLQDAVGINCNKGATTENQGAGVKYMG